LDGFLKGLVLAGTLVFAHSALISDQGRRHLSLLGTSAGIDSRIVAGKFVALATQCLSLLNLLYLRFLLEERAFPWGLWAIENSLALLYVSSLLLCGLVFRYPAVLFVPLYVALGFYFFGGGSWVHRIAGDASGVDARFWILLPLVLLLSVGLVVLCFIMFRNRKADRPEER
jgi:hypothetical protein